MLLTIDSNVAGARQTISLTMIFNRITYILTGSNPIVFTAFPEDKNGCAAKYVPCFFNEDETRPFRLPAACALYFLRYGLERKAE